MHLNSANILPKIFPGKALWLSLVAVSMIVLSACNSDSDTKDADTLYSVPSDVAVNAFSIKANNSVLKGLDSVYFSIDLDRAVIYNADSLPKGTDITRLVPAITYSSYIESATIEMTGGKVRTGTTDYRRQPGDSIDFSGKVVLTLTSTYGNSRSYELKVNVHESEPDSLCWGNTALSKLPSRMASPLEQRTVQMTDKVVCVLREHDGSYTLATTEHPERIGWTRSALSLPFTPRLRTLTACASSLYMLASDGTLYTSTDGRAWSSLSTRWDNILGSYSDELLGLHTTSTGRAITCLSGHFADTPLTGVLEGFPIEDYTNLYSYQSKWMQSPIAVICGGMSADGTLCDHVYGFDGASWALLSTGQLPALRGAVLVPYYTYLKSGSTWVYNEYSTLMLLGGLDAEGVFNKSLYLSYNNGVTFSVGSELLQLPEFIPGFWQSDAAVLTSPMQASLLPADWQQMPERELAPWYRIATTLDGTTLDWQCPYIYLFGGCNEQGDLYDNIWRGVINRLTFTPII